MTQTAKRSLSVLFFLSGVAALVYQVVWQRILSLSGGVGVRSMAVVVGAFMLGLGLGAALGGRLAERLTQRRALQAFAVAELLLAGFGALSPFLYYDLLYQRAAPWMTDVFRVALFQMIALLPPTILMGASLPLLVRAAVVAAADAPRTIARLFAVNVFGSAVGAVATPWIFLRATSMTTTAMMAAGLNAIAGVGALLLLGRASALSNAVPTSSDHEAPRPALSPAVLGFWALLFGTSGFVALGLEMVWFRIIDVTLKGTAFTFGTVLGLYLFGLAAGAALPVEKVRDPMRAFAICQATSILWAILAVLFLAYAPETWPGVLEVVGRMASYRGRLGPAADPLTLVTFLVVPAFLFVPATVAMGVSFGLLQRGVQTSALGAAHRAGLLQAANVAGSLLGSLVVGLASIEMIGTAGTLRTLGIVTAISVLAIAAWRRSVLAAVAAVSVAVVSAAAIPENEELWKRLHARAREGSIFREDSTAVVALIRTKTDGYRLTVNGAGHSELPYGGTHTLLGALATALHPAPEHIAVIGLGSGNTAWAALARGEVRRADIFEIAAAQRPALQRLATRHEFPELGELLDDPRVSLTFDDGRRALSLTNERFDVIEIDALYPWAAWSGNIYSVEFFDLCRRRLAPGGLFLTWAPTDRIRRSVAEAFPFSRVFLGDFVVGANEPIPATLAPGASASMRARLGEETIAELERIVAQSRVLDKTDGERNRDLHPRDEFTGPGGWR